MGLVTLPFMYLHSNTYSNDTVATWELQYSHTLFSDTSYDGGDWALQGYEDVNIDNNLYS